MGTALQISSNASVHQIDAVSHIYGETHIEWVAGKVTEYTARFAQWTISSIWSFQKLRKNV